MSEWWTYGLRDLLMFAPGTYYRLFELYHEAVWPWQGLAVPLAAAALWLWPRRGAPAGRALAVLLAVCWCWVGWAYLGHRYATINSAAVYFAHAWGAQGILLLWAAVRGSLSAAPSGGRRAQLGLALLAYALLLHPLLAPLSGRGWAQAELFGMMPDPTAVATLGLLLRAEPRRVAWLLPVPAAWCLVSGATLWAMQAPEFPILPLAALLSAVLLAWSAVDARAGR